MLSSFIYERNYNITILIALPGTREQKYMENESYCHGGSWCPSELLFYFSKKNVNGIILVLPGTREQIYTIYMEYRAYCNGSGGKGPWGCLFYFSKRNCNSIIMIALPVIRKQKNME